MAMSSLLNHIRTMETMRDEDVLCAPLLHLSHPGPPVAHDMHMHVSACTLDPLGLTCLRGAVQSGTDQAQAYFQIYAEAIGQVRKWADPDALTPEQVRALAQHGQGEAEPEEGVRKPASPAKAGSSPRSLLPRQRSARRASFQDVRAQPTQTTVMTSAEKGL